ncbi:ERMES complex Ca(2+)-binding regulatory GTPase gem1 [Massospora cicadina]|nr:ERMES complex Ca(2+)-binding regulatory GTPase gem1 [Massospora cicadina]
MFIFHLHGFAKVGKSTLVNTLIKDAFVAPVQPLVPEVTIPPEATPEKVTTHLIDTARYEECAMLSHELRKADVVCMVYSSVVRSTFHRIPEFWLPYLQSLKLKPIPVVLVGNKSDLKVGSMPAVDLEDDVVPLMKTYREIETCLECSAKANLNVAELFYFCQKAVLYPTSPLYDSVEQTLKPKCVTALRRIFALSDTDKDGILNDEELNGFQRKCFGTPLDKVELQEVKAMIGGLEPAGVTEVGLTVLGFLFLHGLFIQRGRLETTWSVLRKFGYGDDLVLRDDVVHPPLDIPPDCTVELSPHGYQFFTELFQSHDKDNDGALNEKELCDLFSLCPAPVANPWAHTDFPATTLTNSLGAVSLQGFLAQWSMSTLQDPQTTLAYLAYLGYEGDTRSGLRMVRPKHTITQRRRRGDKVYPRSVFMCYVLGGSASGKTSILRAFVNKPFQAHHSATLRPFSVVNSVDIYGAEKYLVLEELGANHEALVLQNKHKLEQCDLLCLVYDASDPNSFLHLMHLRAQYELDHLPYVIVATKCDVDQVRQRTADQPEAYCKKLGIAQPVKVSAKSGDLERLFGLFASVAMNPTGSIPGLNDRRRQGGVRPLYQYLVVTALTGAFITTGYLLIRALRPYAGGWFSSFASSRPKP